MKIYREIDRTIDIDCRDVRKTYGFSLSDCRVVLVELKNGHRYLLDSSEFNELVWEFVREGRAPLCNSPLDFVNGENPTNWDN